MTLRLWKRSNPTLGEWEIEKAAEKQWKAVRVLDAEALADWLELHDAVAARLAREVLKLAPATDARSTDEYWNEYSNRFQPALTEQVLLAGREEQAKRLLQQLQSKPAGSFVQADSHEEVVAFTVAAIRRAEPEQRRLLESRTLILDSETAARQLMVKPNLIFLPRSGALKLDGPLAQRNPTVIPLGRDDPDQRSGLVLDLPHSEQMEAALRTMGLSEGEARRLAQECGRSVTVLERRIPSGRAHKPEWFGRRELIPAFLAGAWNARTAGDQEMLAELCGMENYFKCEDALRSFLMMQDPPIERVGDVWKVRAPVDSFLNLAPFIGSSDLERLHKVATKVFSEIDPALDLPPEDRPYAAMKGKQFTHSHWLRRGLASTLRLISNRHRQAQMRITGVDPERFVSDLIAALPGLKNDFQLLASLEGDLILLMEAAPRPLLDALGHLLEGDGAAIRPLFRDTRSFPFGAHSPHTGVLWALEMLAWDPLYLEEASVLLAKLASVDPGGQLVNRPINSLREIFLPWHPSTNATLTQRLAALDKIIMSEPQVGWNLLLHLLPSDHSIATNTPKPRYREAGSAQAEGITYGIAGDGFKAALERALTLAANDVQRWIALLPYIRVLEPSLRTKAIDALDNLIATVGAEDRTKLWRALRPEVMRHRAYQSAKWAMTGADLARLESVVASIAPERTHDQIDWLFDTHHPDIPDEDGLARWDKVQQERERAVKKLVSESGLNALVDLANTVELPFYVASAAYSLLGSPEHVLELVDYGLKSTKDLSSFIATISAQAQAKFGERWELLLLRTIQSGHFAPEQIVNMLLNWPDEEPTWNFVDRLDRQVNDLYWTNKYPRFLQGTPAQLERAARRYADVGRPLAALTAIEDQVSQLSPEIVLWLLDKGVEELNAKPGTLSTNVAFLIEQIFDKLRVSADVSKVEIARREYAYLPLFMYREKRLALHEILAQDPTFFVQLLCDAFKPASGPPREPTDEAKTRARAAFELLSNLDLVPGSDGNNINLEFLTKWVHAVRIEATEKDRAAIGDEFIGHVLAHSPFDTDGAWPHRAVREVIELVKSKNLETGIDVERFNMRGVTTRAMYEGGDQERSIAGEIRGWAAKVDAWPRTKALLLRMAESWERHAEYEDERAKQDELRFES